ncbi:DNA translocase FtsK [Candidatus Omnitrophota bacterium]
MIKNQPNNPKKTSREVRTKKQVKQSNKPHVKLQHINEIKAIILLAIAVLILVSLISYDPLDLPFRTSTPNVPLTNFCKIFGAYLAEGLFFLGGWGSYLFVALLLFWARNKFLSRETGYRMTKILSILVLYCILSGFFGLLYHADRAIRFTRGGIIGLYFADFLLQYFGRFGSYLILLTLGLLSFILISEYLVSPLFFRFMEKLFVSVKRFIASIGQSRMYFPKRKEPARYTPQPKAPASSEKPPIPVAPKIEIRKPPEPKIAESNMPKREKVTAAKEKPQPVGDFQLPSIDLLDDPPPVSSRQVKDDLITSARILEETLGDFGVSVRVADIERGPVITRYELEPAPGVKVQRIATLSDDISLAMKSPNVRIVAPIPGKSRVGIEVPNTQSNLVYLKELLSSDEFKESESKLTLALGKDIAGHSAIADLDDMPHLLIAGTTGSGKTVCMNSLIMSMLFNASPQEVKFIMVDPKMVELAPFNGLPHLLCPVITDPKRVASALNWVVNEMEQRYSLLAGAGARNITAYNQKNEKIPYIVVIIDELADLMQVSAAQVESAITRLAQLSRAVGIHLILATQRPSVNVITGVVKANFPARISFKVASKVDSRTVLDMNGADKLLGRGDMLFMQPGEAKPIRAQGSLVKDAEIEKVVKFISAQQEPVFDEDIMREQEKKTNYGDFEKDELFDDAVRLVVESNQASVSIIQRRMRLGHTRAARLIDMMEQEGIIGCYRGSKPREILVDRESWLKEKVQEDGINRQ